MAYSSLSREDSVDYDVSSPLARMESLRRDGGGGGADTDTEAGLVTGSRKRVRSRLLGTPVFLVCNPHSNPKPKFGVESIFQHSKIFGVWIDALQPALQRKNWIGVQHSTPHSNPLSTPHSNPMFATPARFATTARSAVTERGWSAGMSASWSAECNPVCGVQSRV